MGTWGPGIYQNDTSDDVKAYFNDQLHRGKNARQITDELIKSFAEIFEDKQENQDFWCALADTQWKMGRLLPDVKDNALASLEGKSILLDWEFASGKDKERRLKALCEVKDRIVTQQPPEKKVSQYRLYSCPWNIGDVYALPFDEADGETSGLSGQYILMEMAGTTVWYPGHEIPVVYLKITYNKCPPRTIEEYEDIGYLKIDEHRMNLSFLPITNNESKEITYIRNCTDERGMVNIYRLALITTSKRSLPKNLEYVGNFKTAKKPSKEYIPIRVLSIQSIFYKELKNIVSKILRKYNKN